MLDYQKRVITEKQELDEKRAKLEAFVDGDAFRALATADADLLIEQKRAMRDYSAILAQRIARFGGHEHAAGFRLPHGTMP